LRHDADRTLTIAAAWALFALCCISPIVWMLFGSAGSGSLAAAATGLADERQRSLMVNTLALGAGATILALVVGAPVGIVLARCAARVAGAADFSRAPRSAILRAGFLLDPDFRRLRILMGVQHAGSNGRAWPFAVSNRHAGRGGGAANGSRKVRGAAQLSASPTRVFVNITLPLMAAAVSASLLIVFVLATSEFAVPGLLRVRVYTTEVFTGFAALYDFRLATVMALPLAGVAALASIAALHFIRQRSQAAPIEASRVDVGTTPRSRLLWRACSSLGRPWLGCRSPKLRSKRRTRSLRRRRLHRRAS
jgi:ABC-type Fe3+ transport system permease subunit